MSATGANLSGFHERGATVLARFALAAPMPENWMTGSGSQSMRWAILRNMLLIAMLAAAFALSLQAVRAQETRPRAQPAQTARKPTQPPIRRLRAWVVHPAEAQAGSRDREASEARRRSRMRLGGPPEPHPARFGLRGRQVSNPPVSRAACGSRVRRRAQPPARPRRIARFQCPVSPGRSRAPLGLKQVRQAAAAAAIRVKRGFLVLQ